MKAKLLTDPKLSIALETLKVKNIQNLCVLHYVRFVELRRAISSDSRE